MTVTINLTPELEERLRQAAAKAGVALDSFIVRSVQERLGSAARSGESAQRLTPKESELLLTINDTLAAFPWKRYHELIAKRQEESLAPDEHADLVALSDQIEAANAQRIALLAELAQLRGTSVPALMADLGLRPHE